VRERTDIASDPAHRAGGGVVLKASLASSFGRRSAGDKQLHRLSVAFALLVNCATATHPHSGWGHPCIAQHSDEHDDADEEQDTQSNDDKHGIRRSSGCDLQYTLVLSRCPDVNVVDRPR
jgi:hypothetical protein